MTKLNFHAPESLHEAEDLLDKYVGTVRLGAGCTYLMLMATKGEQLPAHLVSLHKIPGLKNRTEGNIGSGVTLREIAAGPRQGPERALTMAASCVARPNIRNLATIGGNLSFIDGDLIAPALALDAIVQLSNGNTMAVDEYVKNKPRDLIATGISHKRRASDGWSGATVKLTRAGVGWPVITASVVLQRNNIGAITASSTAVQALTSSPVRLPGVDAILVGTKGEVDAVEYASEWGLERQTMRSDMEASATYRRKVAPYVLKQAIEMALVSGADEESPLRAASL